MLPVKIPTVVRKLFPNYIWDIPTTDKVLYLTFDDGPTPIITDWTLDVLRDFDARATFFCIGNNIKKHPEILCRIKNEGHAIGNHTFNHLSGWKTKTEEYVEEVLRTENLISSEFRVHNTTESNNFSLLSQNPKLFRPPYGRITLKQGRSLLALGYKIVMWDIVAFDWKETLTPQECYQNVISKTTSGSIIVFHDSLKASKNMQYAIPKVLAYFSEKGFEFRRIPV